MVVPAVRHKLLMKYSKTIHQPRFHLMQSIFVHLDCLAVLDREIKFFSVYMAVTETLPGAR